MLKARFEDGQVREELFQFALAQCDRAVSVSPMKTTTWVAWGNVLSFYARTRIGQQALDTMSLAIEKFEKAIEIMPNDIYSFSHIAVIYARQAQLKIAANRHTLRALAKKQAESAIRMSASQATYNVACMWAVLGEENECERQLISCRDSGECVSRVVTENDPDFESIRDKPWFLEFLESLDRL
jgi:tetratricopeptide (TPR) repeat protein